MRISFQKKEGDLSLGIAFFWRLQIDAFAPEAVTDYFIPELFYDYLFVRQGSLQVEDSVTQKRPQPLPAQTLKTIHTTPLTFSYSTPLVLFGARLTLRFAESFWGATLAANQFLLGDWVNEPVDDLASFANQISEALCKQQGEGKTAVFPSPAPIALLQHPTLAETPQLANYSPRHKRRLYKNRYGLSRKEMQSIQSIHTFLAQACDFSNHNPHIIDYLNDEHFYDQPHLNNAFKKMTGFSLMAYFEANTILQDNLMAVSYNDAAA